MPQKIIPNHRTINSKQFLRVSVLFGRHARITFEVFSEKRDVGEIKRVGYLLDGHARRAQFGLRIADDERRDDVGQCLSRNLLDSRTQVLGRKVHLFGIKRNVSLRLIILDNDAHQFFHDFLITAVMRRFELGHVSLIDVSQEKNELAVCQINLYFVHKILHAQRLNHQFHVVAEYFGNFRFEVQYRSFENIRRMLDGMRKQIRASDQIFRETYEEETAICALFRYLKILPDK